MTALSDADWRITYLPVDGTPQKPETVRAAYPSGDKELPGWTLLKNYDHKIVKMLRSDGVQSIERVAPDAAATEDAPASRELRYAPDATGQSEEGWSVRIGNETVSQAEARARGFARASNLSFTSEWVQADGFMIRGLFRRGDAQRFSDAELRDLVAKFLNDHGVDIDPPDKPGTLEAFCFNYEMSASMDQLRERAAADAVTARTPDTGMEAACSNALESLGMRLSRANGGYAVHKLAVPGKKPALIDLFASLSQVADFTDARMKAST